MKIKTRPLMIGAGAGALLLAIVSVYRRATLLRVSAAPAGGNRGRTSSHRRTEQLRVGAGKHFLEREGLSPAPHQV